MPGGWLRIPGFDVLGWELGSLRAGVLLESLFLESTWSVSETEFAEPEQRIPPSFL